jgi:hypothetical protein
MLFRAISVQLGSHQSHAPVMSLADILERCVVVVVGAGGGEVGGGGVGGGGVGGGGVVVVCILHVIQLSHFGFHSHTHTLSLCLYLSLPLSL